MADDHVQGTPSPSPPPCAKGCGFFGSPSTMNMCSKCFREYQRSNPAQQQQQQQPPPPPPPQQQQTPPATDIPSSPLSTDTSSVTDVSASASSPPTAFSAQVMSPKPAASSSLPTPMTDVKKSAELKTTAADPTAPPPRKIQKNTSRCFSCRKKIGLTGFKCRCGYFYCSEHRYSDKHDCDFDYQASARQELEKANPVVVASKLEKI